MIDQLRKLLGSLMLARLGGKDVMTENQGRIRVNRALPELEIEGSEAFIEQWWDRVWNEIAVMPATPPSSPNVQTKVPANAQVTKGGLPEVFGEFYSEFRPGITDIDKILIAAVFTQLNDAENCFTTSAANQLLLNQNEKVANASECVRRLIATKRAFPVPPGRRFRVSSAGFEYVNTLKSTP